MLVYQRVSCSTSISQRFDQLESLQAGGFVHSGGGTDWVKASEIAEKDKG